MTVQSKVQAASLPEAMALAFAEIESATKAANNPHFKSKYADLTSVIEAIKPALVKHGLFFTQNPRPHDNGVEIETVLHHAGGDVMSLGSLFVPADRNNAQGFGSALTYARRYALVTAFGVPVEDDDGNAASQPRKAAAPGLIADADCVLLIQLIEATGTDTRKFCQAFNVSSVKALPAAAFPKAKAQLERKMAQMAEPQRETADA
jgi:hypothetical protein